MIADFEAQCMLDDDHRVWRFQSHASGRFLSAATIRPRSRSNRSGL